MLFWGLLNCLVYGTIITNLPKVNFVSIVLRVIHKTGLHFHPGLLCFLTDHVFPISLPLGGGCGLPGQVFAADEWNGAESGAELD